MRTSCYIMVLCLCLFTSCQDWWENNQVDDVCAEDIYLSASVAPMLTTKVPYRPQNNAPSSANPLNVDVWASTTAGIFMNEGKNGSDKDEHQVAIHTTAYFQSGEPQLLSAAVYPPPVSDGNAPSVFFVAMHPKSAPAPSAAQWTTPNDANSGRQALFTFDGSQDVMFAKQVSGKYNTSQLVDGKYQVTESPCLEFKHLLTLITLKMGIQLEAGETPFNVQEAWGRVMAVKIQAANDDASARDLGDIVSIDLSNGNAFDIDTDVSFSGNSDGYFFESGSSDRVFPTQVNDLWFDIPSVTTEVAYTMCQPQNASAIAGRLEYIITVTTENREVSIPLDLKSGDEEFFSGSTRAKHFSVTLLFKKGRATAITAVVSDWQTGGYGFGNITDE